MDYKKEILNTNWYFWACINFYKIKKCKIKWNKYFLPGILRNKFYKLGYNTKDVQVIYK